MKSSEKLIMLTAEDIRYAKHTQLAALTGIDASNFSAWGSSRGISERNIDRIAEALGMSKLAFMEGLELRRKDAAAARSAQEKLERYIQLQSAS